MISASVTYLKKAVSQKYKNAYVSAFFNTSAEAYMLTVDSKYLRSTNEDLHNRPVCFPRGVFLGDRRYGKSIAVKEVIYLQGEGDVN